MKQVKRIYLDNPSAVLKFLKENRGRWCSVTHRKRTTNEINTMNGRCGIKYDVKGIGKKFNDNDRGIINFSEIPLDAPRHANGRFKKGYKSLRKSFGVETIMRIVMNGEEVIVRSNY